MPKDSERYSFIFIVLNFIKNVFLLIIYKKIFIKINLIHLNKNKLNFFLNLFLFYEFYFFIFLK